VLETESLTSLMPTDAVRHAPKAVPFTYPCDQCT